VPLASDGSARFTIPGGLPILLHLTDDAESKQMNLPRWQRETMTFVPGESTHQGFRGTFFNNLCGGCHGSISGKPIDAALNPDFLTGASNVISNGKQPTDLTQGPSGRGGVLSPPFTP
jgi:hypothetical protein